MKILFLCDKKKCEVCHPDKCEHTMYIEHAANIPDNVKEWIMDNFDILQPENIAIQKEIILH